MTQRISIKGYGDYERMGWAYEARHAKASELYSRVDTKTLETMRMLAEVLDTFERLRANLGGKPLTIKSARRSQEYQNLLRKSGYRAAKTSAHVYGAALDVATPWHMKDSDFAHEIFKAAEALHFPPPRVGYLTYRGDGGTSARWVHYDYAFLLLPEEMGDAAIPEIWKRPGLVF